MELDAKINEKIFTFDKINVERLNKSNFYTEPDKHSNGKNKKDEDYLKLFDDNKNDSGE